MCLCFVNDDRKWRGHLTGTPPIKSAHIIRYCRPGVRLPYESDGDARRLALAWKLHILVSITVFGMESHYICPFRYRLLLCIRTALTLTTQKSPLGVSLSSSHTHIGLPYGFNVNFPTSIPVSFIWESPRDLRGFPIGFSGSGIFLIYGSGFGIVKQSQGDIREWKYAREVGCQK